MFTVFVQVCSFLAVCFFLGSLCISLESLLLFLVALLCCQFKKAQVFVKVKSCLFMESSLECVLCELLLAFKKEGKTHGLFSSYHYYFLLNICFLACFGHAYTI